MVQCEQSTHTHSLTHNTHPHVHEQHHVHKCTPQHGISGEEEGDVRLDAKWVWVLDPIDGTKSFITGKPLFGTLIGLLCDGVPVLGMQTCVYSCHINILEKIELTPIRAHTENC